ncbi:MAG: carboxypeptidase regulatory-like domain-containing protein [Candidatus Acidiferrales bacterium]
MILPLLFSILQMIPAAPRPNQPANPAPSNFRISGRVLDALSGSPVAGVTVSILPAKPPATPQIVITESGGQFLFEHVLPGKYQLLARRKGSTQQLYQQHENFSTAIVAGEGLDSENIVFLLTPESSIEGQITDQMGEAVRHATVMLFRQDTAGGKLAIRLQTRRQTNDEGRYRFPHLAPGTYFVAVSAQVWFKQFVQRFDNTSRSGLVTLSAPSAASSSGETDASLDVLYPITYFPNVTDSLGAAPFILQFGDHSTADITLSAVPDIHVRIHTGSSDPSQLPQIQVTQGVFDGFQQNLSIQQRRMSPDTIEVSGLPPGHINMRVQFPGMKDAPAITQEMQAVDGAEIDLANSPRSATVVGQLQLEGSKGLPQPSQIQLRNLSTGEGISTDTTLDGKFDFRGFHFQPDKYDVLVFGEAGYSVRSLTASGARVNGRVLTISAGQEVRLEIRLSQGVSQVEGIALRDGKPLAGAMIVLVPRDPENLALYRRDQSDSDGTFTLPSVGLGSCTVIAIADGWNLEWSNPAVLAKYLPAGIRLKIESNQKYKIEVKVQ